jgi:hypothetical protein
MANPLNMVNRCLSLNELAISVQANVNRVNIKLANGSGRSQNGQPVEYGWPLFII